ncbi:WD40 repeat domain-containing protein [Paractinoplanes abujensis]|uniref:WD40 repeat protein n=1 Tax=Paractinoplanes abujensis TaxID=882441 RepID=A0A7W7CQL5_9ACTN|nr:WD40 repeat domain-containing protein [Actinoplanes abujensis]MBB4692924.1 WD40 repeat protein [Actinoplanes abujensis]
MRTSPYRAMTFRRDARRLTVSAPNGELTVWDTADPARPRRAGRLRLGRGIVAAAWNPAVADLLATASVDGTGAVWRLRDDRPPEGFASWAALPDRPQHVGWVAGGAWIYVMTGDGRTSVWDVGSGACVGLADLSGGRPVLAAHYRGDEVVVVTDSGWARAWHPKRRPGEWVRLTGKPVSACTWSSTLLVVAGVDGQATCFDAEFRSVQALRVARERPRALACAEDGRLVASCGDTWAVAVDRGGTVRWETTLHSMSARSIAVAGDLIAVCGPRPRPVLLALTTGVALTA